MDQYILIGKESIGKERIGIDRYISRNKRKGAAAREGKTFFDSKRVSNELGAGNSVRAKQVMDVALKLSFLLAVVAVLTKIFGHDAWVGFFTDSSSMTKKFASMTPLLAASIAIDIIECVLLGFMDRLNMRPVLSRWNPLVDYIT
ncbi:hypothetical protein CRYUN_Cryun40dG0083100 [Craigia yunnanensis]